MPSLILRLVLIAALILCFCQLPANASRKRQTALVTPINYDSRSTSYTMEIGQRAPMRVLQLMLDIEQDYMWVSCDKRNYSSSTYRPVACGSTLCKSYEHSRCTNCYGPRGPGCNNHTCAVPNPSFELGQDTAALLSSDGSSSGPVARIRRIAFACAAIGNLSFLPRKAAGVAGMSSSTLALPAQLFAAEHFSRKFAMCLPGGQEAGVLSFGGGPLVFVSPAGVDLSSGLIRTPLIKNPVHSSAFYIGVQRVEVNGVHVPIDADKLRIDTKGRGGTKLSTVVQYTQLATPIYNSLVGVFTNVAKKMNISRVASVAPFGACFNLSGVAFTHVGPAVPTINLVLQGNGSTTVWSIFAVNSMVEIKSKVSCLGFVDGGLDPTASIVIGTYQMQDNLLQFDLANSTLGFSSSLYLKQTACSNFNFTTSL